MKSYSEMCRCGTYEERLAYLQLHGEVGKDTFGFDRYLNQDFYRSKEWRQFRDRIIVRDGGCDLGCKDHPIADIAVSGGKIGYDPYNAKEFVERWAQENGPFGIEKVIQGARTESVPLGELKKLSEQRKLLFDEALMEFAMGNCITLEDTNGNRKLYKQRHDKKIDAVAALMDAYVAWKLNRDAFE